MRVLQNMHIPNSDKSVVFYYLDVVLANEQIHNQQNPIPQRFHVRIGILETDY